MLLILDNCEHVISAAAELVGRISRACPGMHVLATSREQLGIDGERVYRVPPLALELAAARLATMSLEHLAGRLDQRFRLLTGGGRNALPRQQTLRARAAADPEHHPGSGLAARRSARPQARPVRALRPGMSVTGPAT